MKLVEHLHATINVRNVTDKTYLACLMWGQAYHAVPRSVAGSLRFEY